MISNSSTMRQLSADELDQVGGGLAIGATLGLGVDLSSELKAVSGVVGQVGGLVENLAGGALKAVGGVVGKV